MWEDFAEWFPTAPEAEEYRHLDFTEELENEMCIRDRHNVEPLIGYDLTEVKAAVKTLARSNRYIPRIIVNGAVKLGVLRGDRFLSLIHI